MAGKITDYPTMTTLASGDLMDVSDSDGLGGFTSKSLDWDDLKTNIEGQITFANIYSNDGTLSGNRIVSMLANDLTFLSTIDANLLKLETTFGRVGIGIASPSVKLEVFESINNLGGAKITNTDAGSGAYASISFQSNVGVLSSFIGQNSTANAAYGGAGSLNIGTIAARPVSILTSGTSRMFINSTGEVGIVSASANGADLALGGTIGEKFYLLDSANPYGFGIQSNLLQSFVPVGASQTWGSGTSASFTERMRINSTGFGIGTATPTEKLEVVGNGYINGRLGVNAPPFGNAASYLISISGDLYGKRIIADNLAANGFGLYVRSTSPTNNFGIYGKSTTTGSGTESSGVEGISDGTNGTNHYGVRGRGKNGSSLSFGGYFQIEGGASVVAANRTSAVYGLNQSTNSGQNIAIQGISLSTSGISYGLKAEATGAATTNYGGYFRATTATNNYAIIVPSGGGNVGIGTTTPDANAKLDVNGVIKTKSYVVASLPTVVVGGIIYVSDETGGAVLAFSDGVDWRRVTDRAIVS